MMQLLQLLIRKTVKKRTIKLMSVHGNLHKTGNGSDYVVNKNNYILFLCDEKNIKPIMCCAGFAKHPAG